MIKFRRSIGATLIEIVLSVLIVGIAFLAIFSVIQFGSKSTVKINNYSKAFRLAQEFIEEFKHLPIGYFLNDNDIVSAESWFECNKDKYCPKTRKSIDEFKNELKSLMFYPEVKVVKNSTGSVKFILIRVQVDWKEGDGTTNVKPRQIRLANAIYNPASE